MTTTTTIASLADNTLLDIFNRLSVAELLPIGGVNARFRLFRSISGSARRTLNLLICPPDGPLLKICKTDDDAYFLPCLDVVQNDDGTPMNPKCPKQKAKFDFASLRVTSLSMEYAKLLAELLSDVVDVSVRVEADSIENVDPLIWMLEQWVETIVRLRIYLVYEEGKFDFKLAKNIRPHVRLLSTINSMTALRRLDFHIAGSLIKNRYARIILPVLDRLERFIFSSADRFDTILGSIKRYAATNGNLAKIQINSLALVESDYAGLLQFEPRFASRFEHLFVAVYEQIATKLQSLSNRFTNLSTITILFLRPMINRDTFYRALRPLIHMVQIEFVICGPDLATFAFDPEEVISPADQIRLPSVKMLTFILYQPTQMQCHHMFSYFRLRHIFPNLQAVKVDGQLGFCQECTNREVRPSRYGTDCFWPMMRAIETSNPHLKAIVSNGTSYILI